MPRRSQNNRLKVLRRWAGQPNDRRWVLRVADRLIPAPANQLIVFEILHENLGTVVSYARLYSLLRRPSSAGRYHLLQEYIRRNVEMLERNKLPYVIAVAKQTGYALCRVLP
jgi:DNA-binding response OmpR family regulator